MLMCFHVLCLLFVTIHVIFHDIMIWQNASHVISNYSYFLSWYYDMIKYVICVLHLCSIFVTVYVIFSWYYDMTKYVICAPYVLTFCHIFMILWYDKMCHMCSSVVLTFCHYLFHHSWYYDLPKCATCVFNSADMPNYVFSCRKIFITT